MPDYSNLDMANAEGDDTEELHQCGNCGDIYKTSELSEAEDLWERCDPGGMYPSGECPDEECRALCYPMAALTRAARGDTLLAFLCGAEVAAIDIALARPLSPLTPLRGARARLFMALTTRNRADAEAAIDAVTTEAAIAAENVPSRRPFSDGYAGSGDLDVSLRMDPAATPHDGAIEEDADHHVGNALQLLSTLSALDATEQLAAIASAKRRLRLAADVLAKERQDRREIRSPNGGER